jgi:uncharacterized protein YfdQ (DUF2303 family)
MIDIDKLRAALLAGTRMDSDCVPEDGPVLLPAGMTLATLEPFMERPARTRGTYTTNRIEDFTAYCEKVIASGHAPHGAGNAHLFVDENAATPVAKMVFDFGSVVAPMWREDRAVLVVEPSPEYAELSALMDAGAVRQDAFVDFVDDWASQCTFLRPDGKPIDAAIAKTEFADLTVDAVRSMRSKVTDFQREKSAVEKLSMGKGLPNRLLFACRPWKCVSGRQVTVRLSAFESGGTLALKLTHVGAVALREALVDELTARLDEAFSGTATVVRGTFDPGLRPISA